MLKCYSIKRKRTTSLLKKNKQTNKTKQNRTKQKTKTLMQLVKRNDVGGAIHVDDEFSSVPGVWGLVGVCWWGRVCFTPGFK